ncbi:MAG: hypothetical protein CVU50_05035 [Candidatus Cloacimonetes bacterium HGW-Cloacimonetes-3]|jgi:hypothetical protein|nr:MAG: hypothetical protein CVU50_05035 [Candidatus Cloacimonetes bacterium HGW-Cloacimonetes-3]
MKKAVFILLLVVFTLSLAAQTGLFDLYFGESYEDCDLDLYYEGFTYSDEDLDGAEIYVPYEDEYLDYDVDHVRLYFENGKDELTGWAIYFIPSEDCNIEEVMVAILDKKFGASKYGSKETFYYWPLKEPRFLEADYTDDGTLFYVEFGTEFED